MAGRNIPRANSQDGDRAAAANAGVSRREGQQQNLNVKAMPFKQGATSANTAARPALVAGAAAAAVGAAAAAAAAGDEKQSAVRLLESLQKLQTRFSDPVTLDFFQRPVILSCGHTVEQKSYIDLAAKCKEGEHPPCPSCREQTQILPIPNFVLNDLHDDLVDLDKKIQTLRTEHANEIAREKQKVQEVEVALTEQKRNFDIQGEVSYKNSEQLNQAFEAKVKEQEQQFQKDLQKQKDDLLAAHQKTLDEMQSKLTTQEADSKKNLTDKLAAQKKTLDDAQEEAVKKAKREAADSYQKTKGDLTRLQNLQRGLKEDTAAAIKRAEKASADAAQTKAKYQALHQEKIALQQRLDAQATEHADEMKALQAERNTQAAEMKALREQMEAMRQTAEETARAAQETIASSRKHSLEQAQVQHLLQAELERLRKENEDLRKQNNTQSTAAASAPVAAAAANAVANDAASITPVAVSAVTTTTSTPTPNEKSAGTLAISGSVPFDASDKPEIGSYAPSSTPEPEQNTSSSAPGSSQSLPSRTRLNDAEKKAAIDAVVENYEKVVSAARTVSPLAEGMPPTAFSAPLASTHDLQIAAGAKTEVVTVTGTPAILVPAHKKDAQPVPDVTTTSDTSSATAPINRKQRRQQKRQTQSAPSSAAAKAEAPSSAPVTLAASIPTFSSEESEMTQDQLVKSLEEEQQILEEELEGKMSDSDLDRKLCTYIENQINLIPLQHEMKKISGEEAAKQFRHAREAFSRNPIQSQRNKVIQMELIQCELMYLFLSIEEMIANRNYRVASIGITYVHELFKIASEFDDSDPALIGRQKTVLDSYAQRKKDFRALEDKLAQLEFQQNDQKISVSSTSSAIRSGAGSAAAAPATTATATGSKAATADGSTSSTNSASTAATTANLSTAPVILSSGEIPKDQLLKSLEEEKQKLDKEFESEMTDTALDTTLFRLYENQTKLIPLQYQMKKISAEDAAKQFRDLREKYAKNPLSLLQINKIVRMELIRFELGFLYFFINEMIANHNYQEASSKINYGLKLLEKPEVTIEEASDKERHRTLLDCYKLHEDRFKELQATLAKATATPAASSSAAAAAAPSSAAMTMQLPSSTGHAGSAATAAASTSNSGSASAAAVTTTSATANSAKTASSTNVMSSTKLSNPAPIQPFELSFLARQTQGPDSSSELCETQNERNATASALIQLEGVILNTLDNAAISSSFKTFKEATKAWEEKLKKYNKSSHIEEESKRLERIRKRTVEIVGLAVSGNLSLLPRSRMTAGTAAAASAATLPASAAGIAITPVSETANSASFSAQQHAKDVIRNEMIATSAGSAAGAPAVSSTAAAAAATPSATPATLTADESKELFDKIIKQIEETGDYKDVRKEIKKLLSLNKAALDSNFMNASDRSFNPRLVLRCYVNVHLMKIECDRKKHRITPKQAAERCQTLRKDIEKHLKTEDDKSVYINLSHREATYWQDCAYESHENNDLDSAMREDQEAFKLLSTPPETLVGSKEDPFVIIERERVIDRYKKLLENFKADHQVLVADLAAQEAFKLLSTPPETLVGSKEDPFVIRERERVIDRYKKQLENFQADHKVLVADLDAMANNQARKAAANPAPTMRAQPAPVTPSTAATACPANTTEATASAAAISGSGSVFAGAAAAAAVSSNSQPNPSPTQTLAGSGAGATTTVDTMHFAPMKKRDFNELIESLGVSSEFLEANGSSETQAERKAIAEAIKKLLTPVHLSNFNSEKIPRAQQDLNQAIKAFEAKFEKSNNRYAGSYNNERHVETVQIGNIKRDVPRLIKEIALRIRRAAAQAAAPVTPSTAAQAEGAAAARAKLEASLRLFAAPGSISGLTATAAAGKSSPTTRAATSVATNSSSQFSTAAAACAANAAGAATSAAANSPRSGR